MKVCELKDELLDFWVAKADDKEVLIAGGMAQILYRVEQGAECYQVYSPSTDWSQGGPLIERERILVQPIYSMSGTFLYWNAKKLERWYTYESESYLMAAMRCLVGSRFGEEVDDS